MSTVGNWRGPNIIKDGLVLYLDAGSPNSFYDKNGLIIKDISGSQNNGTLINGPIYDSSNGGNLVFDNTDDYISLLSDGYGSVFDTQNFSIEFWYKTDFTGTPYDVLWSYDYTSHTPPYYAQHLRVDSVSTRQTVLFGYNISGVYNFIAAPLNSVVTDTWYNIAVTVSPSSRTLYINGTELANSTSFGNITYYNKSILIGSSNITTGMIKGNIATVRFYNKTLSSSEILQNYNVTKGRFGL